MKAILTILAAGLGSLVLAQSAYTDAQAIAFGEVEKETASLSLSADYGIHSNRISHRLLNQAVWRGRIEPEAAAEVSDWDEASVTRLKAGTTGSALWRSPLKNNIRFILGLGLREQLWASMATGLAQLYLRGNGPFEDIELNLGPTDLRYLSAQYATIGFERHSQSWFWGLSLQAMKVSRYYEAQLGESTFYTAPFGTEVLANVQFNYWGTITKQNKAAAWMGTAAAADAYLVINKGSHRPYFSLRLSDLGLAQFNGITTLHYNDTFGFRGLEVANVLAFDDSLVNGSRPDSLGTYLDVERGTGGATRFLPASVTATLVLPLGAKGRLHTVIKKYYAFVLPEVEVGYTFSLGKRLALSPQLALLGFGPITPSLGVFFKQNEWLAVAMQWQQFGNILAPGSPSSQALSIATQWRF